VTTVVEEGREQLRRSASVPPDGRRDEPITVILTTSQRLVRDMLSEGLEVDGTIRVIATGRDAAETLAEARRRGPAVVIICDDIGFEERVRVTQMLAAVPDGAAILHVVDRAVVTDLADAVEAGARGYVSRDAGLAHLRTAIGAVADGRVAISEELIGSLLDRLVERRVAAKDRDARLSTLSVREREVLMLLADGASSEAIAAALTISKETARKHVQNILVKMGVRSRLEAVAYVIQGGRRSLLTSDE
jgi:DNA-binding NarL/FixJ family response regulator